MLFAVIYYVLAVMLLLYCAYTHKMFKYYTAFKAAASCGFIAVAILCVSAPSVYFYLMLGAFILCLMGDIGLGLANNSRLYFGRYFIGGVVSFAAAHVLFSAAFTIYSGFNIFDAFMALFALGTTYVISRLKSFRFSRMNIPALIYSCFVGLTCARGMSAFAALGTPRAALMAIGAVLFLISDCSILFLYFTVKKPRRFVRVFNLLSYYAGLLCLALSM